MRVLVVNAGSSSLKLAVVQDGETRAAEAVDAPGGHLDDGLLRGFLDRNGPYDAVGHRIVHGGTAFVDPVLVDVDVIARLNALTDLAPLHQPKSLAAMAAVSELLPQVPAVACFDTAFHARMPAAAATYALPAEWRARWPLRRFGFHGLSHAYASRRAAELMGREAERLRVVTCHLGAGASLAAVAGGVSVDTTMGFTPLDGLVMATRSGAVDPGLVLWLQAHAGMPASELAWTLEHRSGLLGLAGTGDMRSVLDREASGHPDAAMAIAVYVHRLRAAIASMTAAMDGLDALVFTGGVGERAAAVRARAADGLGFLGVSVDPVTNAAAEPDVEITGEDAVVRTWVIVAREDLEIARQVARVIG
jgi:acetate kinase